MKKTPRVLILGAGAAGLACARELKKAALDFHIFEARDRIGGRAHSLVQDGNVIEYGAEFIHGAQPTTLDLLRKNHSAFIDVCDNRLLFRHGKLFEEPKFWEDLEKITNELDPHRKKDRSVSEFIRAHQSRWSKDLLLIFKSYVEGYQAADLNLAGEKALAQSESEDEPELNGQSQFRPAAGYSHFMDLLRADAGLRASQISLRSPAEKILWDDEGVEIRGRHLMTGKNFRRRADFVVITVPMNVLKTSLQITPEIPALTKSVQAIPMGHLQRITFEFDQPFWENLDKKKPVGFLHANTGCDFPTWWTQMPKRNSLLIAWQGGPRAYAMSAWSKEEKVAAALKTLSQISGRSVRFLRDHLVQAHTHDWTRDPYCQGAYCYGGVEVPGANIRRVFEGRIVIAGEGTMEGVEQGTIHGAMHSGVRAAKQILAKTKGRP